MTIFLLRHGLAVEPGTPGYAKDSDRPLTAEGKQKLGKIGKAMKELGLAFDLILSSPYLRTRQTADIVAEALNARGKLELSDSLAPGGSPKKLIDFLNKRDLPPENVLLVGHEPYLSQLISLLLSGSAAISVTMKKGGLCKLSVESLRHGRCARLEWLLTPKQMVRLS